MTANLKPLFVNMMNDFTHLIIHTIISKNRIDADPAILVKQFYMHFNPNPTNKNTNTNTNISPFTKHFFDQFIQKIKPNLPITYSHSTTSYANSTNDTNQLQRGFKGRPSKPKIITIDTTNIDNYYHYHYDNDDNNNNNNNKHILSPNRYSKHYAHLSTSHELIEEPFDAEFDTHTRTRTRTKRSFNYNGIPLLIDNSNLLYKPHHSLTPFAIFNYSLHKIIPLPPMEIYTDEDLNRHAMRAC
jgi:hypothetical protein